MPILIELPKRVKSIFSFVVAWRLHIPSHQYLIVIFGKMITAVFVGILGIAWFFTTHYEISPTHRIVAYDLYGKEIQLHGLRTKFNTRTVAISFAKYYGGLFPHYQFCLASNTPQIKRRFLVFNHK
ncbi:MAG: hypothetical protein QXY15_03185 [Candidatus Nitrosotenuis sp.]